MSILDASCAYVCGAKISGNILAATASNVNNQLPATLPVQMEGFVYV